MNALLKEAIVSNQDFEWYPTTDEIITSVVEDLRSTLPLPYGSCTKSLSILDAGAGDGRVLTQIDQQLQVQCKLFSADLLAIEKATPLLQSLPAHIGIVGTDFFAQSLTDKQTDVIFSNPPYSCFEDWTAKLISEANTLLAYLVIPKRWVDSPLIQRAIESRQASVKVLGRFDFTAAERKARAQVDLIRVCFVRESLLSPTHAGGLYRRSTDDEARNCLTTDPFSVWFDTHFADCLEARESKQAPNMQERVEHAMVSGATLMEALETLYQQDLASLLSAYQHMLALDPVLMQELGVSFEGAKAALRSRISGLKQKYWEELFSHLESLTQRLTSGTRGKMLQTLKSRSQVDYSADNAYAIVIWACKNANRYYDDQIVETFQFLIDRCDVVAYRSNEKLLYRQDWRYQRMAERVDRPVKLEYRLVVSLYWVFRERYFSSSAWELETVARDLLDDLQILASNFGFEPITWSRDCLWEPGKPVFFQCRYQNQEQTLMRVKAHKNGNLHIQFHPDFILRLNVEAGRLMGWIGNPYEAAQEFGLSEKEAQAVFGSNFQIAPSRLPGLLAQL